MTLARATGGCSARPPPRLRPAGSAGTGDRRRTRPDGRHLDTTASRICAELEISGLLARGAAYGTYRIGAGALALSGHAARPYSSAVDFALTATHQATGETVALVTKSPGGAIVVGAVESAWTLRVATRVGDCITDPDSAALQALRPSDPGMAAPGVALSTIGATTEMATPILTISGDCVAALMARYPGHRAQKVTPMARRALLTAREQLEASIAQTPVDAMEAAARRDEPSIQDRSVIAASAAILNLLTTIDELPIRLIATRTGIRPDRARRLIEILALTGFVTRATDRDAVRLAWAVHGWHRAIVEPTLGGPALRLVASTSDRAGTTAYLTIRQGMRSSTIAEAIVDGALNMGSWLGRPGQLIASDGGPVLMMNLDDAQIQQVFPLRINMTGSGTPKDLQAFLLQVHRARSQQVLVLANFGEDGLTSIAAPVRDASGSVVAAACIVGPADHISARLTALKKLACELAEDVSQLLRNPEQPQHE